MRPLRAWETLPTIRLLALLPVPLALSGMVLGAGARALGSDPAQPPVGLMAGATAVAHVLILLLVHLFLRWNQQTWKEAFGFFEGNWARAVGRALLLTLPAMAAALVLHQGCVWLLQQWGISAESQAAVEAARRASAGWEQALLAVTAVIGAPVIEEVLFRGVFWPMARDTRFPWLGAAGVSLAFALIHFNAAALVPLWALGMFWIWLYERTGTLLAPITSHAVFNGANLAWLLLARAESVS